MRTDAYHYINSSSHNYCSYLAVKLNNLLHYVCRPQGRSQEFQKGVSINGRMSIKQRSVGVQFQMLISHTHVHFKFNTFLPNKLASEQFHIA